MKNGKFLVKNVALDDGRAGYKWIGRADDVKEACQRFLDKHLTEKEKKRRRRFGNY